MQKENRSNFLQYDVKKHVLATKMSFFVSKKEKKIMKDILFHFHTNFTSYFFNF